MRLQQQHSSLGISQALEEEIRKLEEEQKNKKGNRNSQIFRSDLTDAMFKVPSQESSFLTWSRFYISLYYNKVYIRQLTYTLCLIYLSIFFLVGCQYVWVLNRMVLVQQVDHLISQNELILIFCY